MKPFQFWRCDTCGEPVALEEGYVIWGREGKPATDFRIIHKSVCDDDSLISSLPLADFVGADGLAQLTAMLSYGMLTKDSGVTSRSEHDLPDLDAWVDFVRRVQIPHYEQVRLLYLQSETREALSDAGEVYPYLQRSIESLMKQQ